MIVAAATAAERSAVIAAAASLPPELEWYGMALDNPAALEATWWAAA